MHHHEDSRAPMPARLPDPAHCAAHAVLAIRTAELLCLIDPARSAAHIVAHHAVHVLHHLCVASLMCHHHNSRAPMPARLPDPAHCAVHAVRDVASLFFSMCRHHNSRAPMPD
eukprot:779378-Pelagomonas_calceolata.AAC.2